MALLEVKNLHTSFHIDAGVVNAVNGISFFLERGKVLGKNPPCPAENQRKKELSLDRQCFFSICSQGLALCVLII